MYKIDKAIKASGGTQTDLAKLLSGLPENKGRPITQSHVSWWRQNGTPPKRCLEIEKALKGKVTRYDLRPDIFGERCKKVA